MNYWTWTSIFILSRIFNIYDSIPYLKTSILVFFDLQYLDLDYNVYFGTTNYFFLKLKKIFRIVF